MPEVCASAAVYRRAMPAAAATRERAKSFGARPISLQLLKSCSTSWISADGNLGLALARDADPNQTSATAGAGSLASTELWMIIPPPWTALTIELLHRNRDVRVPGDVNLVANLDLIQHSRIDDMSDVLPSVRTNEGDRRCVLVDSVDGRGHRSLQGCRAPRPFPLPRSRGPGLRINRCLARRLQSR